MGTYSFKSSGTTQANAIVNAKTVARTPTPVGIKTPLSLGSDDLLTMTNDIASAMGDNLRNLIMTNWGERLGLYNFGANLRPLTANFVSLDDFDSRAISNIRAAVQTWMPFIDLQDFSSAVNRTQNQNTAVIDLTITYNIPSLSVKGKQLLVSLYAM